MKVLLLLLVCLPGFASKIGFWDSPRRGTNFFNEVETQERFLNAKKIGVEVVRLTFNKWKSAAPGGQVGDFLIGPAEKDFVALQPDDLKKLISVLDWAEAVGVKVVLTQLSLPGLRWVQHNQNVSDFRLWQDFKYHRQAEAYWTQLATALKGHPAVVGYNLLNEPHPEKVKPRFQDWYTGDYAAWEKMVRDTPRDLNQFHEGLVRAIRAVDKAIPIVVDSGFYALPAAFKILRPLADDKVIYSFHMYEPGEFTSYQNVGKYRYPGKIPVGESETPPLVDFDRPELSRLLEPVRQWQRRHRVISRRILAGEFGVFRGNQGAAEYLGDLVSLLTAEGWHWAFYSFQEDTWAGMDYELGPQKFEKEELYPLAERQKRYRPNGLWDVLLRALKPQ